MRAYHQRQILELLKTIKQVQADGLYADCQNCAVSIGTFIESIKGKDTQTVALLEEYCELLYKASLGEVREDVLRKCLLSIENSVRHELHPDKIEIVFLSYKASMSDSLESIYIAAKDDPHCDAYWIPIPYYDKGDFGEMKYEGADYYDQHIQCTGWQEYNIKERHPDVIFTFNAYDENNYVTSVHPKFYCRQLRKFTELLVYVPYFILRGHNAKRHFATLPGCLYAHKVILQSKSIRDCYVDVIKVLERTKNCKGYFGNPDEKFVALGSPKIDKVINAKREDCKLPYDWQQLIGSKKVILYNTSLTAFLAGNEQYLEKLRCVLDIFRRRSDVVLWWRPHPLSKATYQSMRPHLADEYLAIVEEYMSEGWGIYDDSADLSRSILMTDLYYGDGSSVATLYSAVGKPVIFQDANVLYERKDDFGTWAFASICEDDDCFWSVPIYGNALFRLVKSSMSVEFVGTFDSEPTEGYRLFNWICQCNGKIYAIPRAANAIGCYDKASGEFTKIDIDYTLSKNYSNYNEELKFGSATIYGTKIYLMPYTFPAIIALNTVDNTLSYYDGWVKDVEKICIRYEDAFFWNGTLVENKLFLPTPRANAVFVFNLDDMSHEFYFVGKDDYCASSICFDGTCFWLNPKYDGNFVRWDYMQKSWIEVLRPDETLTSGNIAFMDVRYSNGRVWCLAANGSLSVTIDVKSEAVEAVDVIKEKSILSQPWGDLKYSGVYQSGDRILALSMTTKQLVCFDTLSGVRTEYDLKIAESVKEYIHWKIPEMKKTVSRLLAEDKCEIFEMITAQYITLNDLLDIAVNADIKLSGQQLSERGKAGQEIYNYVKGLVLVQ